MEVLIDADFLLEALLNRENLVEDAERLWNLLENKEIQGLITDIGFKKICIFVKKLGGLEAVEQITSVIESMVNVQTVDRDLIEEARSFDLLDFESAVEIVCAYTWNVGAIVTQNIKNFSQTEFPIVSISQLLERQTLERLLILSVPIKIPIPLLTLSLLRGTEIFTLSLLWVMISQKLEAYNKTTNNTLLKKAPEPSSLIGLDFMADISNVMDFTVSSTAIWSPTLTVPQVPEPSNLIGLGFISVLGLAGLYKRKKN